MPLLRPALDGRLITPQGLAELLTRPDVLRRQTEERRERAYGTLWRVRLEAGLRDATIDRWADELADRAHLARRLVLAKAAANAIGLLFAAILLRALDRLTCGYRRPVALLIGMALAAVVTLAVWWR